MHGAHAIATDPTPASMSTVEEAVVYFSSHNSRIHDLNIRVRKIRRCLDGTSAPDLGATNGPKAARPPGLIDQLSEIHVEMFLALDDLGDQISGIERSVGAGLSDQVPRDGHR